MSDNELGDFLTNRRATILPADVGLPGQGRRRVPGLRREEVAILAGVSPDYYAKLEQGHGAGASPTVLDAISDVLGLNQTEREHLYHLAKPPPARNESPRLSRLSTVRSGLIQLLDAIPDVPAVLMGPAFEQLAWNKLADALFDIQSMEDAGLSAAQQIFLDPAARTFYPKWDAIASEVVGYLRFNAGRTPDAPALLATVGELSVKSPDFRAMWSRHTVREKTSGSKQIEHPLLGSLELSYETFRLPENERMALITYTAEPGSASAEKLKLLGSWSVKSAVHDRKPTNTPTSSKRTDNA
ncbi:helix-turn-helix transcriptional regulator [Microbacterium sp. P05]|uniref:helix-turn-helix transcriptional regulator n=1 Tax=Microbacterium sp. P05 TaxID=3366948 RepID=UPI00374691BC